MKTPIYDKIQAEVPRELRQNNRANPFGEAGFRSLTACEADT